MEFNDDKSIEDNNSIDEDEWYNKMEQASFLMDDDVYKDKELNLNENNILNIHNTLEEDYFNNLVQYNVNNDSSIIMSEQHPIWNNILTSIATSSTTTYNTNGISLPMISISNTDYSSLVLIKNWLFNYLPRTSKLYVQVSNMLLDTKNDLNQYLYIDDLLHISLTIIFKIKREDNIIEVCFFTPYIAANEHILLTIDSMIQLFTINYHHYHIVLSSIETNFYESNIMKCTHWDISWIEYCGLFVLEEHNNPNLTSSEIGTLLNILPSNYIYCKLR